ncbi:hypothetical protein PC123_g17405 [Phytophthora cactorum]|nr:hypothetical protein PC123_g17405 [Phytophthora cactorum]
MIDNALWGFVQPEGGWLKYPEMMRLAKAQAKERHATSNAGSFQTKFEADREASVETDPVLQLVNGPVVDMFTTGEPDKSSLVPEFGRRAFVDDICFGGEDFDSCLTTLDRLLTRFTTCRISISFTKSIFCQPKLVAIIELSFPTSKRGMQSFFGALNYYSRFIQDFAVYGAALYQLKEEDFGPRGDLSVAQRAFDALQTKVTEAPIMKNFDRTKEAHVMLFAHEWALSTTLMKEHEDKLHSVRFLGRVLKESEMNYHPAEKEIFNARMGTQIQVTVRSCRTVVTMALESPTSQGTGRGISTIAPVQYYKLCGSEELLAPLAPPNKGSPTIRMDPAMLYARLSRDYRGFVVSFDGSAKTERYGGYGSCSWVLWSLPEWKIVIAANAYLPSTTVNVADYTGMNNGVNAAIAHGAEDLVIAGDSRLAIQRSLGVIECRKESLLTLLNIHKELTAQLRSVKYFYVVREYNAAADSLATEALESKVSREVLAETRKSELVTLNRIQ